MADALKDIFAVFKRLNKYIDETEPWVLARDKENADRLATVMYNLVEGITMGTSLLAPFMPETAEKIFAQLQTSVRDFTQLETFGLYPSGDKVCEDPEILFARLDEKAVMEKVNVIVEKQKAEAAAAAARGEVGDAKKEGGAAPAAKAGAANASASQDFGGEVEGPATTKELISIDDFDKLEFRVGEIIACEEVKKSKKLLCNQVKIGNEVRQILSGIKGTYSAEEMVGKKVWSSQLKPAKLAGLSLRV